MWYAGGVAESGERRAAANPGVKITANYRKLRGPFLPDESRCLAGSVWFCKWLASACIMVSKYSNPPKSISSQNLKCLDDT